MKKLLFILLTMLLVACSKTEEASQQVASDEGVAQTEIKTDETNEVASDEEQSSQIEENYTEEEQSAYEEDPFLEEVGFNTHAILEEMVNRAEQQHAYYGSVEKQMNFSNATSFGYKGQFRALTGDHNDPYKNVYYISVEGTTPEMIDAPYYWERYYYPANIAYDYYDNGDSSGWYKTSLSEEELPSFYLTPAEALHLLQQVSDTAYVGMHNTEQGHMELVFVVNTENHYDFMSQFLIDPIDREANLFNDQLFDFTDGEDVYIYLYIDTIDLLPMSYMNHFFMYSKDISETLEIYTSFSFDFQTEVEGIIVPEEVINAAE